MDLSKLCQICGQRCCRRTEKFGKIALSERDYRRIKEHTNLDSFVERIDSENGWIYIMKTRDDACIFLQEDGKCSIYTFKPLDCMTYPAVFQYCGGKISFFISTRCSYYYEVTPEFLDRVKKEAESELVGWSRENIMGYSELISPRG